MEITPSQHAISQHEHHLQEIARSARRAAIDAEERLLHAATHEVHTGGASADLLPRYSAILSALRHEAEEIDCDQFSFDHATCLEARATEWCAFAPSDALTIPGTAECRYVYRHLVVTEHDNHLRRTETRSIQELIEIRWTDQSVGHAGTPEPLVDLYDTMLILPTGERQWVARPLDMPSLEEEADIEDFLTTIAEPLVAKLRAMNPALVPLPFEE